MVRLLVNSRLLVVKSGGSQKLYASFVLCRGLAPLTPHCSRINCSFLFLALYSPLHLPSIEFLCTLKIFYLTFSETFLLSLLPTHSPHTTLPKSFAVASTQPPTQDSWSNQIFNRGLCSCSMVILGISKIQAPKLSHFIKLSIYSSTSLGHNCIPSNSGQQPFSSSFVKLRKLTLPPGIISEPSFSSPRAIPSKLQVQSS